MKAADLAFPLIATAQNLSQKVEELSEKVVYLQEIN